MTYRPSETTYQRQLSDLVTEVIFGRCAHSEVSPASAKSYAQHNSSKCVCNKCHRKMYYSDWHEHQGDTRYADKIELAHEVIKEVHRQGLAQWLRFVDCFEQGILDDLTPKVTTHTVIDYMMNPEFICRTALKSYGVEEQGKAVFPNHPVLPRKVARFDEEQQ